jgi:hypothetical protein
MMLHALHILCEPYEKVLLTFKTGPGTSRTTSIDIHTLFLFIFIFFVLAANSFSRTFTRFHSEPGKIYVLMDTEIRNRAVTAV